MDSVSNCVTRHHRLSNAFFQTSVYVPLSVSEMQQWMPTDMMKPSPATCLLCLSTPLHKGFLEAGSWQHTQTTQTRHVIFVPCSSSLLTHHQVITLDLSSPWGHQLKHVALHNAVHYENAIHAFEVVLSKIIESPNSDVQRKSYPCYHDKVDLFRLFDRVW